MNVYKLVWKFGKEEHVLGNDIASAFNNAGIGNGALKALDYWEEVDEIPDNLKRFELLSDNKEPSEIHNPYFLDRLKQVGFIEGNIAEVEYANRKFTYQFIGKSKTGYQYIQV